MEHFKFEPHEFERGLRRIGKGVCIKSFPLTAFTERMLELFFLTHGGFSGIELTFLPCQGSIYDNPNLFFEASNVIGEELNRKRPEKKAQDGKTN